MTHNLVLAEFPAHRADGVDLAHVAQVILNRPEALNALNGALMIALVETLEHLDANPDCHVIVLRGAGERAFAAGADIKEMAGQTPDTVPALFEPWTRLRAIGAPLIAAVRGYALGGGCELAMACDMIVAADDAQFGQPELKLGIIPGAGGTQRLTRAVGKARAMELILTGRTFTARDAERWGLVSSIVAPGETFDAALDLAGRIAAMPRLAVRAAKAAMASAEVVGLEEGLALERQAFFGLFATEDQKEGMQAFVEKRPANFRGR